MASEQRDPAKLVVFNFLQWLVELRASDPHFKEAEGLEVATQCLIDAFHIELDNVEQQKKYSIKPMALPAVVEGARLMMERGGEKRAASGEATEDAKWPAFLAQLKKSNYFTAEEGSPAYQKQLDHAKSLFKQKFAGKPPAAAPATAAASAAAIVTPAPVPAPVIAFNALPADERKKRMEEAEKYKTDGNQKLSDRQYHLALEAYTAAIALNPTNAIYYGNRAAACEFLGDSEKAIADCKEAVRLDPNYAKAYSRLGLSFFSLGCYKDAVEQYRKAVQLDATNAAYRESLTKAELKLAQHPDAPSHSLRTSTGAAPAAPAAPVPAAAGGLPPNLANMDPETMKGMMNELGGLGNVMSNPAFLNMAQKMMSDPQFMNMAQQMLSNPEMAQMLGNISGAKK